MFYLDTCVLVSAFSTEAFSFRAVDWLLQQTEAQLLISDWQITEFSSALSIKLRTRQMDMKQRSDTLAQFTAYMDSRLQVLPVSSQDFRDAAHLANYHQFGLRSGDALHLAVASRCGLTLATLDSKMANAGQPLGIKTLLLNAKNQINE